MLTERDLLRPIGRHFTLGDLLKSQTAARSPKIYQEQYSPDRAIIENLEMLMAQVIDPLLDSYLLPKGLGVAISSGYRCATLNQLIGGSKTSQHVLGQAVDFVLTGIKAPAHPGEVYVYTVDWMIKHLTFDQLIWEYGTSLIPNWLHVSYDKSRRRKQVLEIGSHTQGKYVPLDLSKKIEQLKSSIIKDK